LRELNRAFRLADKAVHQDLRDALEEAAQPVRSDAQSLATQRIRRIGPTWARMRVGTAGGVVYVAPVERGAKGRGNQRFRRPNLADLMMSRAMEPALERNEGRVIARVNEALNDVHRVWEHA
jgi:hypothetical protein